MNSKLVGIVCAVVFGLLVATPLLAWPGGGACGLPNPCHQPPFDDCWEGFDPFCDASSDGPFLENGCRHCAVPPNGFQGWAFYAECCYGSNCDTRRQAGWLISVEGRLECMPLTQGNTVTCHLYGERCDLHL